MSTRNSLPVAPPLPPSGGCWPLGRTSSGQAAGGERALDERSEDVEQALAAAAVTVEATYTTAYLAHVPLETRAAVAQWDGDRLTVLTGSQVPFGVRRPPGHHLPSDAGLPSAPGSAKMSA